MQKTYVTHLPDIEAKAWRVHFRTTANGPDDRICAIHEPRTVFAKWMPADIRTPPTTLDDDAGRSLAVLWMPPGASSDIETSWLSGIPTSNGPSGRVVRAGLRTSRVVWTDTRAIVYAAPEQLDEALEAVARFTIVERDARMLEAKMAAVWHFIERDTRLTHTVRPGDHWFRKRRVNRLTDNITQMAASALRLESALEQVDPLLPSGSKRLFAELALQAELYDRLEVLSEPIDFALEHYELVNTRMIEAKWARTSLSLETAILIALLVDVVFVSYPIFAAL